MALLDLIDQICKPDSKVIQDHLEWEITFKRNRHLFLIQIIGILLIVSESLISYEPLTLFQKAGLFLILAKTVIFMLTCRSYPTFFKASCFISITLFGPLMLYYLKESIFFLVFTIILIPKLILYLFGAKAFIVQVLIQIIYLNGLYESRLLDLMGSLTPEVYLPKIVKLTTFTLIVNSTMILLLQVALAKANHYITIEKTKKASVERQKTFLLSFSHELRNLINTMIGAAQLSLLESLPTKVRELLHNSEVCGELLLHLVNNILDTGKAVSGELEINPTPNMVYGTLEKVWSICSQLIKTKRLFGQMTIHKNLPERLKIDNYRLMQIMMNLIGNAIKFTDNGTINIDVQWITNIEIVNGECFEPTPFDDDSEGLFEKSQTTCLLNKDLIVLDMNHKKICEEIIAQDPWSPQKGVLKIVVSDTGCGIPADKLPMLFSKFSQVNNDPSKRKLGTGLGLFITKEMITKMGGDIRAFSRMGKGTAIIACIPAEAVLQDESKNVNFDSFVSMMQSRNIRALVVDDEGTNRILLSNYLNKLGVQDIEFAQNGFEAVSKYKDNSANNSKSFDIITMDVNMPVMDGKRATQVIRSIEKENNMKRSLIIMVSGNCSESEINACIGEQTKADFFLKKPTSMIELFNVMKARIPKGKS